MQHFSTGQLVRIKRTKEVFTVVDDNGGLVQVRNEQDIKWFYGAGVLFSLLSLSPVYWSRKHPAAGASWWRELSVRIAQEIPAPIFAIQLPKSLHRCGGSA